MNWQIILNTLSMVLVTLALIKMLKAYKERIASRTQPIRDNSE